MPEIKHNFTGGKMNKDLDERIVPNGEYRDAMNIQVSTSEGSEVGTVQNILGNSLVSRQDFIEENSYCVGSIADEKNDKLYYFVTGMVSGSYLINGDFKQATPINYTQASWNANYESGTVKQGEWTLVADQSNDQLGHGMNIVDGLLRRDDTNNGSNSSARQKVNVISGVEYTVSYKRKWIAGGGQTNIYMDFGDGNMQLANLSETTGDVITVTDTFTATFTGEMFFRIFFIGDMEGEIDDVTMTSSHIDRILEYDSKNDSTTPVLVDTTGDVLKFNPDNIITGINIIDDMLFWTDNNYEPKKINISRSIEGTGSSGLNHTNFVNEKTSTQVPLKEEHITVIKKQPILAPRVNLVEERDPTKTYSGIMRITSQPTPITLPRGEYGTPGGTNSITNSQNTSSMWIDEDSWTNHHYDFSGLSRNDNFDTFIETDINGENGFTLDWAVGDTLVFKAFEGENYDETPSVPLSSFSVKAKILDSSVNNFVDGGGAVFTNGDFKIPNANGTKPAGWTFQQFGTGWDYDVVGDSIIALDEMANGQSAAVYKKFWSGNLSLVVGASYKLRFKISNYSTYQDTLATPDSDLFGRVWVKLLVAENLLVAGGSAANTVFLGGVYVYGNGEYEYDFKLDKDYINNTTSTASFVAYQNKLMIQGKGEASTPVGRDPFVGTIDYVYLDQMTDDLGDGFVNLSAKVRCKVLGIDGVPEIVPQGLNEIKYVVDRLDTDDKIFQFNFPRIAYRYKYQDGEYSAISPFSQVAFLPGAFDYHPRKGYNVGMSNRIKEIEVGGFMQNIPDGVCEVDILYKEDNAPVIYIVDTIKPTHIAIAGESDNSWTDNKYSITSEQVSRAIESNQLLRPWDNVPKKALSQEVTGSRIVYGNYTQGYDLKLNDGEDYYPDFNVTITGEDIKDKTQPSIKSLRDYQVGAVFIDEHGRETPVVSNKTGTTKLSKIDSIKANKLEIGFNDTNIPRDKDGNISLKYVKFFIKETSGEYYNMAMDRHYNAEDGQIWLSFPSSERNKITVEDYLILKKGVNTNNLVKEEGKYKVLDIKNSAPEFITRDFIKIEEITQNVNISNKNIFGSNVVNAPIKGVNNFKVNYKPFSTGSSQNFQDIEDRLYIEFKDTASNKSSKIYEVSSVHHDYDGPNGNVAIDNAKYTFRIPEDFDDDINFISDDVSGENPTTIIDGISLRVFKEKPVKNAEFDGKFFVKIDTDPTVSSKVIIPSKSLVENPTYRTLLSKEIHLMRNNHNTLHNEKLMFGENAVGVYTGGENAGFGRMAPYFRDYRYSQNGTTWKDASNSTVEVGQYKFAHQSSGWLKELAWITARDAALRTATDVSGANSTPLLGYNSGATFPGGTSLSSADIKYGDDHAYNEEQRNNNSILFIDKGPYSGKRTATISDENFSFNWSRTTFVDNGLADGVFEEIDAIGDTDTGGFELGFGGIYSRENPLSTANDKIENFWNVGDLSNQEYSTDKTVDLVQKISTPGQQWRWDKDPTREVYTTQKLDKLQGRYRADTVVNPAGGSKVDPEWPYENGNNVLITDYTATSGGAGDYRRNASLLSPNYTTTFFSLWLNQDGGSSLKWDPTGPLGPIAEGLELTITASSSQTAGDSYTNNDVFVRVDSLSATNSDGTVRNIEVGMILTKHGSHTLTGDALTDADAPLLVWKIENDSGTKKIHLCGYARPLADATVATGGPGGDGGTYTSHEIFDTATDFTADETLIFQQPTMNGYTRFSCNRINSQIRLYDSDASVHDPIGGIFGLPRIMPVTYNMEFVEEVEGKVGLPKNPAIWETEPRENTPLDIYYEASGYNPLVLSNETKNIAIPIGSVVEHVENSASVPIGTTINNVVDNGTDWTLELSNDVFVDGIYIHAVSDPSNLRITRPDGSAIVFEVTGFLNADADNKSHEITISGDLYGPDAKYVLNWHNCYSFGNGVESNRIRDTFNEPFISNGVKASTTVPFPAEGEENRKYSLIYSGIYNSNSSTNNLNQFISAEKITKEINPIYGSIQKLYSRDTDLVTICEDKVLKILANKDAVFNADGNAQLTANQNVLGQTIPFVGEYGISTNPESFADENYRAYFTDRVRGAVMRLSRDGLTPISDAGMKDWFRDAFSLGVTNLLGENSLSSEDNWDIPSNGNSAIINGEAILGYYNNDPTDTNRFGRAARLRMNNILEVGKTYRLQYTVVDHGGLTYSNPTSGNFQGIVINNTNYGAGQSWTPGGYDTDSKIVGSRINVTWVANVTDFQLIQYQVSRNISGVNTYDSTNTEDYVDNTLGGDWSSDHILYGGIVKIKDISVTEVKEDLKIIGSYDDRQSEYNVSIHGTNPTTVSYKENVKGWESFKSFVPESALSCANDYYTIKNGKIWQHYNPGVNRNTFYNVYHNSTVDVLLNDFPSSIKSYHTLDYEGSQSKIEGIKRVEITGVQHDVGSGFDGRYAFFETQDMSELLGRSDWNDEILTGVEIKQYRNNIVIKSGLVKAWDNTHVDSLISPSGGPTKGNLRWTNQDGSTTTVSNPGDFEVGDVITSKQQEDSVHAIGSNVFNSEPTDGWYVSNIETDKDRGSLLEFIEKEGKWFNNIKGVALNTNEFEELDESTNFGNFNIQGLGIIKEINGDVVTIDGDINISLQANDNIYYERPSEVLGNDIIDTSKNTNIDSGFTINNINTVAWDSAGVTAGVHYINDVHEDVLEVGKKYRLILEVSNYSGTDNLGVSNAAGVSGNARRTSNGTYTEDFIANGDSIDLFGRDTNNGTIKLTVEELMIGEVFGFTRLEISNLKSTGKIINPNETFNSFSATDVSSLLPGDYVLFTKDQIINTDGVSGYYANVKFENNSKTKAELFAVSSEITESSK